VADATQSRGGITAHTLWLYLHGTSPVTISLWPHPERGFQKAGVLHGSTVSLHLGSSHFSVECSSAIAPGSGLYNVYVQLDPARPGRNEPFSFGGSDKGAWLTRKH